MKRSLKETIEAATGGIISVTALALAIAELSAQLDALHQQFQNLATVWLLWGAIALGLFLGLSWLLRGLSRKSRLLRPEALELDPDNPAHLRGRNDDIARLASAVCNRPLVFLEGESGSGKSSLLRSGLIPSLIRPATENGQPNPRLLPIYINAYPGDWQNALTERLVVSAWHALGAELREQAGVATLDHLRRRLLPEPDAAADSAPSLPSQLRNELGLLPLLIFDQFDDYQLAHRERFLRDGRWITADRLCAENTLWNGVARELAARNLQCLVVTRRELFAGLDAVRFEQAESHFLDRVEPAYIVALLEQLTIGSDDAPVIAYPSAGWDALKERIIADLTVQGRVLPIQARIVLKGLIDLPYLGIGAYERAGGIDGLEAGYIEDAIGAAARATGLSSTDALALLLRLVDETDPDLPKARTHSQESLTATLPTVQSQGERLLEVLRQQGVIRPQAAAEIDTAANSQPPARETPPGPFTTTTLPDQSSPPIAARTAGSGFSQSACAPSAAPRIGADVGARCWRRWSSCGSSGQRCADG